MSSPMASLVALASIMMTPMADGAPAQKSIDWSAGAASWKAARKATGTETIWDESNSCHPAVLNSSAPLTVLYGLSSIWKRIKKSREEGGRADKPVEIHVLGAAYPFEGRSDWSMLAKHRPKEVSKLRVVLVLGTPFQSDNVPPLAHQPNVLLQFTDPKTEGKWSERKSEIICEGKGKWGTDEMDEEWSKKNLCRDHGNGVEVVCLEKFYQDVRDELPKPDMAVMFSPGFPQLARRSWDPVLLGLLKTKVPLLLGDNIDDIAKEQWGEKVTPPIEGGTPVAPGGKWRPAQSEAFGEDWQTWLTMTKYHAQLVRARRCPFPISHIEEGRVLAKNAVVQLYEGYEPNIEPPELSLAEIEEHDKQIAAIDWDQEGLSRAKLEYSINDMKRHFKSPTSKAYDDASRRVYKGQLKGAVEKMTDKQIASLTKDEFQGLQDYGLIAGDDGKMKKGKRWDTKAWVFLEKTLGGLDVL